MQFYHNFKKVLYEYVDFRCLNDRVTPIDKLDVLKNISDNIISIF